MNLEVSKRQIIYDIILCQEEWIIRAINQLLQRSIASPASGHIEYRAIESKRVEEEKEKEITKYDFMSVDEFMDMMRRESKNS
ncbi:MAG: hypothetical protein KBF25_01980 [Chitinophagaceae bacterium]|nr:hypothetical protein [Bacteroidota bacterium]MBP9932430.1 hypothetical protein [Chitinophagaceae bacterium]